MNFRAKQKNHLLTPTTGRFPVQNKLVHSNNRPSWLSRSPREVEMVFFDVETTGGNPENSDVIEFAAVKYLNGQEIERIQILVNPMRPIPRMVRQITGIDNDMVRNSPTIHDVIDEIVAFIGNSVLVSHGVLNDYAFLANYAIQLRKIELKNYYICTHLLVSNFLAHIPGKSLTGVAEHFGLFNSDAHRALADAETTANIFWKIIDSLEHDGFSTLEDLLKIQGDHKTLSRLGAGLPSRDVERAPTTPGLFYLFNSNREITYVAATQNIKKSLTHLTQLGEDRDFNRLLVDISDFRFERNTHFLAALLNEKKELKKLSLPIDPRKLEGRANGFVQIFIPKDMLEYAAENPEISPFSIPATGINNLTWKSSCASLDEKNIDDTLDISDEHGFESGSTKQAQEIERNSYAYQNNDETDAGIPIRNTRRIVKTVKSQKFVMKRRPESFETFSVGTLKEGVGWCFGPFESAKAERKRLEELAEHWPFHDSTISMEIRFFYLQIFILALYGRLEDEISFFKRERNTVRSLLSPVTRTRLGRMIAELEMVKSKKFEFDIGKHVRSGLAVISNNDQKELDIAIVVKGRVRREVRLPGDDTVKLRSPRYFTRLFAEFDSEITQDTSPIHFGEETCGDIELFSYWHANKKGEGEWVDFADLSPLYDIELL